MPAGAKLSRPAVWLAGAVVTALIGVLISAGAQWLIRERSESEPLEPVIVTSQGAPGAPAGGSRAYNRLSGFELLVEDPSRLPPEIAKIDDCATLWEVGHKAGGKPVAGSPEPDMTVNVKGKAEEGLTITGMRAVVTKRTPTPDGTILVCPPEPLTGAPVEPVKITFDFGAADLMKVDAIPAAEFDKGRSISLDKNESTQLELDIHPSVDDVEWHIEADAVIGGSLRTLRIDADGQDFRTAGSRRFDDYREGHSAEEPGWDNGPALDWGVVQDAEVTGDRLRWNGVTLPYLHGLEIYVPYGSGNGYVNISRREVRYEGRTLISFNLPGADAEQAEVGDGDFCSVGLIPGTVESTALAQTREKRHGQQTFTHRTIDYTCATAGERKQLYRAESVRRTGSRVAFNSELGGVASPDDRRIARRIMQEVEETLG